MKLKTNPKCIFTLARQAQAIWDQKASAPTAAQYIIDPITKARYKAVSPANRFTRPPTTPHQSSPSPLRTCEA